MRTLLGLASLALAAPALANDTVDSAIYSTTTTRQPNSGWVVQFPTGSEDYFNAVFDVIAGSGNVDGPTLADGLPVTAIALAVADFGSGRTYPRMGVYPSNLAVDSTGLTPDLASPISERLSPPLTAPALFDHVVWDLPEGAIPGGQTKVHGVEQFPPGDSGLLGIGADTAGTGPRAGFTTDGYATPALVISFLEFGINPGQDNTATASCRVIGHRTVACASRATRRSARAIISRRRCDLAPRCSLPFLARAAATACAFTTISRLAAGGRDRPGAAGDPGPRWRWQLPALERDLAIGLRWPDVALQRRVGNAACSNPGAGFTNCVTVVTARPTFGVLDDGTIENGWVNSFPAGPSDYFNNHFGVPPSNVNGVVGLTLAVLDFVTTTPSFASAGVSNANLAVDPSGQTPDVRGPGVLAVVAPFTFPSGTFATTSNQYVSHAVAVPGAALGSHVHGWMQFTRASLARRHGCRRRRRRTAFRPGRWTATRARPTSSPTPTGASASRPTDRRFA
ncbi:MAG: hypothetical protein U1E76_09510 [Planctomycetota bacterium]